MLQGCGCSRSLRRAKVAKKPPGQGPGRQRCCASVRKENGAAGCRIGLQCPRRSYDCQVRPRPSAPGSNVALVLERFRDKNGYALGAYFGSPPSARLVVEFPPKRMAVGWTEMAFIRPHGPFFWEFEIIRLHRRAESVWSRMVGSASLIYAMLAKSAGCAQGQLTRTYNAP
jgi:hypothetical protein